MTINLDALNASIWARDAKAEQASQPAPGPSQAEIAANAERVAQAEIRSRADAVFREYGRSAPLREDGESLATYRARIVADLTPNTRYASTPTELVAKIPFDTLESTVLADAAKNRWTPADLKPGQIREIVKLDGRGQQIHEFVVGKDADGNVNGYGLFGKVYGAFTRPAELQKSITVDDQVIKKIPNFGSMPS